MKKTPVIILCIGLLFICSACSTDNSEDLFPYNEVPGNPPQQQVASSESSSPIEMDKTGPVEVLDTGVETEDAILAESQEIYLTQEQCLDDFAFMFQTLEESYSMFNVVERVTGLKAADVKDEYESLLKNNPNGMHINDFYEWIKDCLSQFQGQGHLYVLGGFNYWDRYQKLAVMDYIGLQLQKEALFHPEAVKTYTYLFANEKKEYEQAYQNSETIAISPYSNITLRILNAETAYIKINSFSSNLMEDEVELIHNFYETIKDQKNLIIDLTENGGGSDWYWETAFVMPNITEQLHTTYYWLAKSSELNRTYFSNRTLDKYYNDKSAIADLPNLNKDDYNANDLLIEYPFHISPNGDEKACNADIYVLTSEKVYSSAESFVMFCKSTAFATIVGTSTGGDGSGPDPLLMALPNSGIVISFSSFLSLNPDGSNNEEYGTKPDYWQSDGETALAACLRVIESHQ